MDQIEFDNPITGDIERKLDDADAYIYVLDTTRTDDGEQFYYVGMSKYINDRVQKHVAGGGNFAGPTPPNNDGHEYSNGGHDKPFQVHGVVIVRQYWMEDYEVEHLFDRRLSVEERRTALDVARKFDSNRVLGVI